MNEPHKSLLEFIEQKKMLSIREFGRSDLYQSTSIEDLILWYEQLSDAVNRNPPEKDVDIVLVFVRASQITRIEYRYLNATPLRSSPFIEIYLAEGEKCNGKI